MPWHPVDIAALAEHPAISPGQLRPAGGAGGNYSTDDGSWDAFGATRATRIHLAIIGERERIRPSCRRGGAAGVARMALA